MYLKAKLNSDFHSSNFINQGLTEAIETDYNGGAEPNGVQTFVFSLLPAEEKKRFMDFLIDNNVEF
jgi:hypothetical protein